MLLPTGGQEAVRTLCQEARDGDFAAVFVYPQWVPLAKSLLEDSIVHVGSVVGFPSGMHHTPIKIAEALQHLEAGVDEIDMVAAHPLLVDGLLEEYAADIKAVRDIVPPNIVLKVIIETPVLTPAQIQTAAKICAENGADYVKTATSANGPCTAEHVRLIYEAVEGKAMVKAAAGIRTAEQAKEMVEAGAVRIGTSSAPAINQEWRDRFGSV